MVYMSVKQKQLDPEHVNRLIIEMITVLWDGKFAPVEEIAVGMHYEAPTGH